MKTFAYIAILLIIGSLVYNLIQFDYNESILSDWNRPFIIGIGSGVCGLILAMIILRYNQLRPNLENQSEK